MRPKVQILQGFSRKTKDETKFVLPTSQTTLVLVKSNDVY